MLREAFKNLVKGNWIRLKMASTQNVGYSLVARFDIPNGEYLFEFVGVVKCGTPTAEDIHALPAVAKGNYLPMKEKVYIDAGTRGNIGHHLDHSTQPTADIETWVVGESLRWMIRANQPISAGGVISVSYPQKLSCMLCSLLKRFCRNNKY